jgi:hypothetical protein
MISIKSIIISLLMLLSGQSHGFQVLAGQALLDDFITGAAGDHRRYGKYLAIDQNMAAVAIPRTGDVLIYEWVGQDWQQTAAFNAVPGDPFANSAVSVIASLDLDQGRVVVGHTGDDDDQPDSGAVRVFEHDGNSWQQTVKLKTDVPQSNSWFGAAVAIDADQLVVGAWGQTGGGAVFVFEYDLGQWQQVQQLSGSDTAAGDRFGQAVALDAPHLLVGAPLHDHNGAQTGGGYLFTDNGSSFSEAQKLLGNPSATSSEYGSSVAIEGDLAVIGAPRGFNDLAVRTGSAYLFRLETMTWVAKDQIYGGLKDERFASALALNAGQVIATGVNSVFFFDAVADDWSQSAFINEPHESVATSQTHLLLGQPEADHHYLNDGRVGWYSQGLSGWDFEAYWFALEGTEHDQFGSSFNITGGRMLVGIPNDVNNDTSIGSAKMFSGSADQWTETDLLLPTDAADGQQFGTAVMQTSDDVFISAQPPGEPGAVYHFALDNGNWVEQQKITAADGFADNAFGQVLATDGEHLFIQASSAQGTDLGAVYVFGFDGLNWVQLDKLVSLVTADQFGRQIQTQPDQLLISAESDGLGQVHVFSETAPDDWQLIQTLTTPPDLFGSARFGKALAIDQDQLMVSSILINDGIGGIYSVQYFVHNYERVNDDWLFVATTALAETPTVSSYAHGLSLAGDWLMLGTQREVDFGRFQA